MDDFENMEWEAPAFDYSAEMKKIRKQLRKRNALIVLTSLVLVAALAFGIVQYGIPALEKQYWDPTTSTYIEGTTDLELTMRAFTELFCPGYEATTIESTKTGFASYSLTTTFISWDDSYSKLACEDKNANLVKGELTFPAGFWDACTNCDVNELGEEGIIYFTKYALPVLKSYPDYVHVSAVVHFPTDLTTEEAMDFCRTVSTAIRNVRSQCRVVWVGIRSHASDDRLYPDCGFDPNLYGRSEWHFGSEYPYLDKYGGYTDTIEIHFTSMLRFLQDQLESGTGFLPPDCQNENYYTDVLNYVEENGVMANTAYIVGAPEVLLDLYESGMIDGIVLSDAWIKH